MPTDEAKIEVMRQVVQTHLNSIPSAKSGDTRAFTQSTWIVVREDHSNAGRSDLALYALNPSIVFVLEMKVLKSFFFHRKGKPVKKWEKKHNEAWANEGIDQVLGYRTAKQAQQAFLLLYDMRKKHQLLEHACARCTTEKVHFRKYDIFNATARKVRELKLKRPKIH